jgi:hypothetical protein
LLLAIEPNWAFLDRGVTDAEELSPRKVVLPHTLPVVVTVVTDLSHYFLLPVGAVHSSSCALHNERVADIPAIAVESERLAFASGFSSGGAKNRTPN